MGGPGQVRGDQFEAGRRGDGSCTLCWPSDLQNLTGTGPLTPREPRGRRFGEPSSRSNYSGSAAYGSPRVVSAIPASPTPGGPETQLGTMQQNDLLQAGVSLALAVHLGASTLRWLELGEGGSRAICPVLGGVRMSGRRCSKVGLEIVRGRLGDD